jgi:hypothetical protein
MNGEMKKKKGEKNRKEIYSADDAGLRGLVGDRLGSLAGDVFPDSMLARKR